MDEGNMTHNEFIAYLETLAQLIEAKAVTKDDAAKIIRDLEVTKVHGIKKAEITPGKKGTGKKLAGQIQLRGETVDTAQIVYTGRLLTPTHFNMTPKSPPDGKGYTLKAEIIKGNRCCPHPRSSHGRGLSRQDRRCGGEGQQGRQ